MTGLAINGHTGIVAPIGFPTHAFMPPMARLGVFDVDAASANGLADRLRTRYPALQINTGSNDPAEFDLVLNGTPLGMNAGDPMPMDLSRIAASTFVGEVVMKTEKTGFLAATTIPDQPRAVATLAD